MPSVLTLGREGGAEALLLLFDLRLDKGVSVVRASVLLDRSQAYATDPSPIGLHANRVIGRWDERRVRWSTAPAVMDVRAPRTVLSETGPRRVRVDVTDLVRRWLAHDPADHGVEIVAENTSPTGVSFVLGSTDLPREDAIAGDDAQPPRLEVYVR